MRGCWKHERQLASEGFSRVAGVDEAGRGPLAGPVVAAAVVLPQGFSARGINDSKLLTPEERERMYKRITAVAHYAVGIASVEEIDRFNILRATYLAMRRAVMALPPPPPDHVLIDGRPIGSMEFMYTAIIDGDARSVSVAAASIIAKVTRDRLMCEFDEEFPHYGFVRHKGYYTDEHIEALEHHGPCPIHRRSFEPVRASSQLQLFDVVKETGRRRQHPTPNE